MRRHSSPHNNKAFDVTRRTAFALRLEKAGQTCLAKLTGNLLTLITLFTKPTRTENGESRSFVFFHGANTECGVPSGAVRWLSPAVLRLQLG